MPQASTSVGEGIAGAAPTVLSAQEFADVYGRKPGAKLQMVALGEHVYSRLSDDSWVRYPVPPEPPAGP